MPITSDPDFPPAIAHLVDSLSRCADGHDMLDVINAAANMLSASLHNFGRESNMTQEEMLAFANLACRGVMCSVQENFQRQGKPTDIPVKTQ